MHDKKINIKYAALENIRTGSCIGLSMSAAMPSEARTSPAVPDDNMSKSAKRAE